MKINLTSGDVVESPWAATRSIGYRATSVELYRKDVSQMLALFRRDPSEFEAAMMQFEARFPVDDLPTPTPLRTYVAPPNKTYRCPACLSDDPTRYVRCHHAGCPDGRNLR